jgi:hypothetical protein
MSINLNKHDASLTSTHVSDQDTNKVHNNSDVNESQSIDINFLSIQKHGRRKFTRNHRNQIHEEEITFTILTH